MFTASGSLITGDFFAMLPESTVGCTGAAAAKVVMGSTKQVDVPTTLSVGKYKVCRASVFGGGGADTLYAEQTMILDGISTVVSAVSASNAVPTSIAAESATALTVTGAATNDYVALVISSKAGCLGASTSKQQVVGGKITTPSDMAVGTYHVCHAALASGGASDALFQMQVASMTVDARKVTVRGTIFGTKLHARLGGTTGSHTSVIDGAAEGCLGSVASTTKLALPAGGATERKREGGTPERKRKRGKKTRMNARERTPRLSSRLRTNANASTTSTPST